MHTENDTAPPLVLFQKVHSRSLRKFTSDTRKFSHLEKTERRMAVTGTCPMGRHHVEAIQDPKLAEAFKHFVKIEEELLHLLEMRVDQDRKMLMRWARPLDDYE